MRSCQWDAFDVHMQDASGLGQRAAHVPADMPAAPKSAASTLCSHLIFSSSRLPIRHHALVPFCSAENLAPCAAYTSLLRGLFVDLVQNTLSCSLLDLVMPVGAGACRAEAS